MCDLPSQCGPFIGSLLLDLKSRCGGSTATGSAPATGAVTVSAVLDALSSPAMTEFHSRYCEGFIPAAIASSASAVKFGKMSDLIAAVRKKRAGSRSDDTAAGGRTKSQALPCARGYSQL